MDKLLKLLSILYVLSLLALPLTGCDNPPWESGMLLFLKVNTPRDGATVTTSTVTVSGRVVGTESVGANLKINDTDVPIKDGKYSTNVTLIEGKNVINIAAKSGQVNLNEKVTVTYVPPKK